MRLLSIASGSSGNSIYIGSDSTHILVDAGISNKRIEEGLNLAQLSGSDIDGICITHEHSDHIKGLGVLARKYEIPIYATRDTIAAIKNDLTLGSYSFSLFREIRSDSDFSIGDITIHPFHTYHDAADPVGFRFESSGNTAAIATDMGHYDEYIIRNLSGVQTLLLESNHDVRMLETGSYPYYLKRRILSDIGHLSNENCGKLISEILHDNIVHIFLGHLSKENNYPDLAYEAVRCEILQSGCPYKPDDFFMEVASREHPSMIIELG
ncbi:MAG: MBL fold metallo-hydrolase [Lachnospiraceae bacterium]|nr:MBL fold metallo-hydrolase [Candidatus Darwinimomas equi]